MSYVVVNKAIKILTNIMTDKTKKTKYKWVIPNTDQISCLADLKKLKETREIV